VPSRYVWTLRNLKWNGVKVRPVFLARGVYVSDRFPKTNFLPCAEVSRNNHTLRLSSAGRTENSTDPAGLLEIFDRYSTTELD
jgi:hypothetical protein